MMCDVLTVFSTVFIEYGIRQASYYLDGGGGHPNGDSRHQQF
jgi:hypothetical protein